MNYEFNIDHKFSPKLDEAKARQVILLRGAGVPLKVIASHFGCSQWTARAVGKITWVPLGKEYEARGHAAFLAKYKDEKVEAAISALLATRAKRIDKPSPTYNSHAGRWVLREYKRRPIFVVWLTDTPAGSGGHTAHNEHGWYWSVADLDNEDPDARLVWDGHYKTSEEAHTAAVDFLTKAPFDEGDVFSHVHLPA